MAFPPHQSTRPMRLQYIGDCLRGSLTAESMAPMKMPKNTPNADPMMPDMTVFTAQLLIRSSWTSCSGVVGSILVNSFFFFGAFAACWLDDDGS